MNMNTNLLDEVQELIWALLDEQATDEQVDRLEKLLLENEEARQTYLTCVQMHTDLHLLYNERAGELPDVVKKAIAAEKAKRSRVPMSLLDLPPAPAGMPMTYGSV